MPKTMQFILGPLVPLAEAVDTLRLARMAAESLHGRERIDLEASVAVDRVRRVFSFDTSRRPGRTLALVFAGYARREFGPENVVVEHEMNQRQFAAENA
jgi:hypothetical protein